MENIDSIIDWTKYEKVEKNVNVNDPRIIKSYVVKQKNSDNLSLVRIYKYSPANQTYNSDEIIDLLTCIDFQVKYGLLSHDYIGVTKVSDDGPTYLEVWSPFIELLLNINEVENLSKMQKQKIIFKIVHSLMILHDHGVIFEYFNPNKILLTDDYDPILFDYGIELLISDNENTEMNYYLSPEKISSLNPDSNFVANVTTKADVYSFGIFLYEFISGEKMDESHLIPIDFNDPFYLTVITKCVHPIYRQRPSMSEVEQMMLEKLTDPDNEELLSYLKENSIEKDVYFDINPQSQIAKMFKYMFIFFVVKQFLPFHIHFIFQFLIMLLIILCNIDLLRLILGSYLLQKHLCPKFALSLIYNAAHNGNGNALLYLGHLFDIGKDVEENYKLSYLFYKLALERGEMGALAGIYTLTAFGKGTLINTPRAELLADRITKNRIINPTEIIPNWIDRIKKLRVFVE